MRATGNAGIATTRRRSDVGGTSSTALFRPPPSAGEPVGSLPRSLPAAGSPTRPQPIAAAVTPGRRALGWLARAVEVLVAVGVLGWATSPRLGAEPLDPETVRAGWWVAYGTVAAVAALRWRSLLRTATHEPAVIALIAIAWLSAAWTALPEFTVDGRLHLTGTMVVAVWLAARFSPLAITALVGAALAIGSMASLGLLVADVPWAAQTEGYGAGWTGVWAHRNQTGIRATLGLVACGAVAVAALRTVRWPRWGRLAAGTGAAAGAVASGVLAYGSQSATPYVVVAAAALCALIVGGRAAYRRGGAARHFSSVVSASGVVAVPVALLRLPATFALLDRRPDITGRTDLWAALWEAAGDRLALGHGYNAFWAATRGPSAAIWEAFNGPPHAHNGYLDVVLELGLVGLVVLLVMVVALLGRLGMAVWRRPTATAAAPLLLAVAVLAHGWSSSPLFAGRNVFSIVLVALAVRVAADVARCRQARPAPPAPPAALRSPPATAVDSLPPPSASEAAAA